MESSVTWLFLRRLLIGCVLSWLIIYDPNGNLVFSDGTVTFFALGTGPLIAFVSCWYHLLPSSSQERAALATILVTWIVCAVILKIDIEHRPELNGLVTVLAILPQLFLITICVTIFGIVDGGFSFLKRIPTRALLAFLLMLGLLVFVMIW